MGMGRERSFGERLRRYRELAGVTQEELAESAGGTATGISSLEGGERPRPYPNTVRSLADALGLTAEERADLLAARAQAGEGEPPAPVERRQSASPPAESPPAALPVPAALPGQLTSLVGRDGEVATVLTL